MASSEYAVMEKQGQFGYRELEELRLFIMRVPKLRNEKPQKPEIGTSTRGSDTRSWRSQDSILSITGVPKL
jgi:hypothetical protein